MERQPMSRDRMTNAESKAYSPIVVTGPSGVGKGTLITMLLEQHPNLFATTTSHTTTSPRPGEMERKDNTYRFVDLPGFQALVDKDAFLEHTVFAGNHYGTTWQTILDQQNKGKTPILDVELNGVQNIKHHLGVRCAFIAPPSLATLEERLRNRATETAASIRTRIKRAEVEVESAEARGVEDILIIDDDLNDAYKRFEEWALRTQ